MLWEVNKRSRIPPPEAEPARAFSGFSSLMRSVGLLALIVCIFSSASACGESMAAKANSQLSKNVVMRTSDWMADYSAIIDVRSPSEFLEDHIVGAINCPVLSNEERAIVGTIYKGNPFEARKMGAAMVAANTAKIIRELCMDKPKDWKPLIYCWRGGQRSSSFAHVMCSIGFRTTVLDGGYMTYRKDVRAQIEALVPRFEFRVIAGLTGCGKTPLLRDMMSRGWQCLDLEGLAKHRGSVLGDVEGGQPAQKIFESLIAHELRGYDGAMPVWVEDEGRQVGELHVPGCLFEGMRKAPRVEIIVPFEERVRYTLSTYRELGENTPELTRLLRLLTPIVSKKKVDEWIKMAEEMRLEELTADLFVAHYDPSNTRACKQHMDRFNPQMRSIRLASIKPEQLDQEWYPIVDKTGGFPMSLKPCDWDAISADEKVADMAGVADGASSTSRKDKQKREGGGAGEDKLLSLCGEGGSEVRRIHAGRAPRVHVKEGTEEGGLGCVVA